MSGNSNPSLGQDPADNDTLGGAFRFILRKALQSTDGMLPAVVIAADDKREYATVRPQVMVLGTDGSKTSRAKIAKVPIFNIGAGGYVLSFPVKEGDAGWIIASDRDISLYLQANGEAGPNTNRLHSFEDGLFIPDSARKWTLDADNKDDAVLQNLDGSVRIALSADSIKMVAPTKVSIDCPLVTMTGDLTVDGTITGKTDVVADTISGKTHKHTGGTISGDTGVPI